jgi:hypothetical protein
MAAAFNSNRILHFAEYLAQKPHGYHAQSSASLSDGLVSGGHGMVACWLPIDPDEV